MNDGVPSGCANHYTAMTKRGALVTDTHNTSVSPLPEVSENTQREEEDPQQFIWLHKPLLVACFVRLLLLHLMPSSLSIEKCCPANQKLCYCQMQQCNVSLHK